MSWTDWQDNPFYESPGILDFSKAGGFYPKDDSKQNPLAAIFLGSAPKKGLEERIEPKLSVPEEIIEQLNITGWKKFREDEDKKKLDAGYVVDGLVTINKNTPNLKDCLVRIIHSPKINIYKFKDAKGHVYFASPKVRFCEIIYFLTEKSSQNDLIIDAARFERSRAKNSPQRFSKKKLIDCIKVKDYALIDQAGIGPRKVVITVSTGTRPGNSYQQISDIVQMPSYYFNDNCLAKSQEQAAEYMMGLINTCIKKSGDPNLSLIQRGKNGKDIITGLIQKKTPYH